MADVIGSPTQRWFDLSRYGAALLVVPANPLRDQSMMVLRVLNTQKFSDQLFRELNGRDPLDTSIEPADLQKMTEVRNTHFKEALEVLGFSGQFKRQSRYDEVTKDYLFDVMETTSVQSQLTMKQLRLLFPALSMADVIEMPVHKVRYRSLDVAPTKAPEGAWSKVAQEVLDPAQRGVWIARQDISPAPYAASQTLEEAFRAFRSSQLGRGGVAVDLDDLRDRDHLRGNACITYYPTRELAVQAGCVAEDMVQVNLSHALPLRANQYGVFALRDFRFSETVLRCDPADLLNPLREPSGKYILPGDLIVRKAALRDVAQVFLDAVYRVDFQKTSRAELDGLSSAMTQWVLADVREGVADKDYIRGSAAFLKNAQGVSLRDLDSNNQLSTNDYLAMRSNDFSGYSLPPVATFKQSDMDSLFRILQRTTNEQATQGLGTRLYAWLAVEQEMAQALAREQATAAFEKVVAAVVVAPKPDASETSRIDDVGEKIGGARKDFYSKSLTSSELLSMNEVERANLVVKANIWPSLDYRAMRDDGVEPRAALVIKAIKDAIPPAPENARKATFATDDGHLSMQTDYIDAVSLIRDQLHGLKTLEEVRFAVHRIYRIAAEEPLTGSLSEWSVYGRRLQLPLGSKLARALAYSGNDDLGERAPGLSTVFTKKLLETVGRYGREPMTDEAVWGLLIKSKTVKSEATLAVEDEKRAIDRHLHRPHLERLVREGQDWRNGRDISGEDLMTHFGFRAIEFGKWLPQDERQAVLNMAFDSFCDLSSATSLPPQAMSFGGTLALAFGSRGTGGKGAFAAHFESARFVINLTRLNGAGSLAHEWFHAFDWHQGGGKAFLSDMASQHPAMNAVHNAIQLRQRPVAEALAEAKEKRDKHFSYATSWIRDEIKGVALRNNPAMTPQDLNHFFDDFRVRLSQTLDGYMERASAILDAELPDAVARLDASQKPTSIHELLGRIDVALDRHAICEALEAEATKTLTKRLKKGSENQVHLNFDSVAGSVSRAVVIQAFERLALDMPPSLAQRLLGRTDSNYFASAKQLDKGRSADYWQTPRELFARAGAAFVQDALAARCERSDYLVYGSDELTYADYAHGNPNPMGLERVAINAALENFVSDYRVSLLKHAALDASVELTDDELLAALDAASP